MSNVSLVNGHIDRPKMTDEEVIKALEYCTNNDDCGTDCPCFSEKQNMCGDYNGLLKQSLDLINRQKAEIEKLENIERIATKTIETQKAEIEKKDIEIDILIRKNETLKDEIAEVKSESKPKQGKWLINPDGYYPYCSECGYEPKAMTKFCPNCGADMKRKKGEI